MIESEGVNDSRLSISVVSHGQGNLVRQLLVDLQKYCTVKDELIVTLNIEETLPLDNFSFQCPVRIIRNKEPSGFSANHNQAFAQARGRYFCVLNPDIRLPENPFPALLSSFKPGVGLVAPKVINADGRIEESARRFPTPLSIFTKALIGRENSVVLKNTGSPDWVAGMFMVFPSHIFAELQGFDQRYYLYYEDVDICARLKLAGYSIIYCHGIAVQHEAQRKSHSDPGYRRHHFMSMARYFLSVPAIQLKIKSLVRK
ncbi:MAG: glycosyltransferase [Desulfobulbaceae bacterium]|nr:glycosyltransferase [Desulfobulbaceae bacterium]